MNNKTYTKQQITEAMETLVELVKHQTGLEEDKIVWHPQDIVFDIFNILEGDPVLTAEIEKMRAPKRTLF